MEITIFVGAILLTRGQIELIPLLMFLLMVTRRFTVPFFLSSANLSSLLNLNVVTNRMRTLLTTPAMAGEEKDRGKIEILNSPMLPLPTIRRMCSRMSPCKIPQGSIFAFVGPSGSGKKAL